MADIDPGTDDKYATFKRADLLSVTDGYVTFKCSDELPDAIVIRRQDYFASPALGMYAASIALALHLVDDPVQREELRRVADYFQRQSELAADEGWKLPTI